jgi:hypothetical protein
MNERIKEIEKQCWQSTETDPYALFDVKKFAEMIIAECMRQIEEQYKPVLEDETMMKDTHWDGYVQCGVDSYVAIREHFFGVEE